MWQAAVARHNVSSMCNLYYADFRIMPTITGERFLVLATAAIESA